MQLLSRGKDGAVRLYLRRANLPRRNEGHEPKPSQLEGQAIILDPKSGEQKQHAKEQPIDAQQLFLNVSVCKPLDLDRLAE